MNLVDSCGWLEYLADGPNAGFFAPIIENIETIIIPSICLYEVYKVVYIQRGDYPAILAVSTMQEGRIINLNTDIALFAGKLSIELKLPLADSVILAIARTHKSTIWTQDSHFEGIPGVKYISKKMMP